MARSPLHNAAFTMAGQLGARLLALVFYAVLARAIGPERYGDQGFGVAVGTLFVSFLEPGLNKLMVRDGACSRAVLEQRLQESLSYKLLMLLLAWPFSWSVTWALGYRGHALDAALWAGGTILVGAVEDVAAAALTALERLDLEGVLRTVSKVLTAGLGILAILLHGSFAQILAATWLGAALAGGVGLVLVRRAGIRVRLGLDASHALRQLRAEWAVALSVVLWLLTLRMDQLVASLMGVGHEELGNYNAAVKIVEALLLFPNAVALAFQPVLSRAWQTGREACSQELRAAHLSSLALTVAIALGGACVAGPLSTLVYGDRFQGTAALLRWQLLALPLVGLQFLAMDTLVAARAVKAQASGVAVNLVVNLVCNLLLVPRLGVLGATLSALAGGAAAVLAFHTQLRRLGLKPGLLTAAWRPVAAGMAMVGALLALGDALPLAAQVVVGGAVYGVALAALGGTRAVWALLDARRQRGA